MNRLVIIGNGFDLAHGLPTSYRDFIDDYWRGIKDSNYNDEFISFDFNTKVEFENIKNIDCISKQFIALDEKVKFSEAEIYHEYGNNFLTGKYPRAHILNYKNGFFRLINQKAIENWVDIENEYYRELKRIVVSKPENSLVDNNEFEISRKEKIVRLNNEFEQVKNLLERYLKEKVEEQYDFRMHRNNIFIDLLLPEFINRFDENRYLKEFKLGDHLYVREFLEKFGEKNHLITYFLSFNYTKVVEQYYNIFAFSKQINYIHGKLNTSVNKVNFGFGDEMDDDYKLIENIDDNEYLKNFKSFQYLQNSNYKSLLDFVESDKKFQVYIIGHSCGLSDRTMLNTIFEHPNCISIKVFYHQREDGSDNYTEIIQNISRHFNKKKLMREKIVNKTLCQPLPQIQLPRKV